MTGPVPPASPTAAAKPCRAAACPADRQKSQPVASPPTMPSPSPAPAVRQFHHSIYAKESSPFDWKLSANKPVYVTLWQAYNAGALSSQHYFDGTSPHFVAPSLYMECGSPTAAFTTAAYPSLKQREPGSRTPQFEVARVASSI